MTLTKIRNTILELEARYNLLEYPIHGVKIWQAIRVRIFHHIASKTGTTGKATPIKDYPVTQRLKNLHRFLYSCIFKNPLFSHSKKNTLIFDHSRKILVNGHFIDIYTQYLIDKMTAEGKNFMVYEEPHQNQHYTKSSSLRQHLDIILISANIYAKLARVTLTEQEKTFLNNLQATIQQTFNITFNLTKYFKYEIKKFTALNYLFTKLLKHKRPKEIFVLVGYGHTALINAAKKLQIKVIEIQHGTITDFHLGYHFPGIKKNSLDYFPDEINLWDHFWKKMCTFPISEKKLNVTGFTHLEQQLAQYNSVKKNKKQIIVISQGPTEPALSEIMLANIQDLAQYAIIYKLHPNDYDRWKTFKPLLELSLHKNVTIITDNKKTLHHWLAESAILISVYSTTIFESLYFNCKIILVKLPGIENMQQFIKNNKVPLLTRNKKLLTLLKKDRTP